MNTIFSALPFLQQEVIGQAVWWNHPTPFFETLFDPMKTDGHPGRFRYAHYIVEAIYWKLFNAGVIPQDLYDYSALLCCLLLTGFVFWWARSNGLSRFECTLIAAVFLLSAHNFLLVVYHHRKAKYLVSLLFAALAIAASRKEPSRRGFYLLSMAGFFTDPYFILLGPLFCMALDKFYPSKPFSYLRSQLGAFAFATVFMFVLNGIIGPAINPDCQLVDWPIARVPFGLLNPTSIPLFYDIVPDLVAPKLLWTNNRGIAWTLVIIFWASIAFTLLKEWRNATWIWLLIFALPITAFLVRPGSFRMMFVGYYGHPIWLLFILMWIEILRLNKQRPYFRWFCWSFLLSILLCHQSNKIAVYDRWVDDHVFHASTKKKYIRDYHLLNSLKEDFRNKQRTKILSLDFVNLKEALFDSIYEFSETGKERRHTLMAYMMIPLIFRDEIQQKRLVLRNE